MASAQGGFLGGGGKVSDQTGANTINPNQATEANQSSAPIISFQSNISTSGKNAQVVGGGSPDVTVYSTTTDFGALAAGANLAALGLNVGGAGINLAGYSLDKAGEMFGTAIASNEKVSLSGLDNAQKNYASSLSFANSQTSGALGFAHDTQVTLQSALNSIFEFGQNIVGDVITANRDSTSQTITGLTDLSARTTTSSDQRIQEIAKYAIYAAVAIAIALVAGPAFKAAR